MVSRLLLVGSGAAPPPVLRQWFVPPRFEVSTVTNTHDALTHLGAHEVDLVLLHVRAPANDDWSTVQSLRAGRGRRYVPLVVVTDSVPDTVRRDWLRAGVDELFEKPLDEAVVRTRLQTLLRLQHTADVLAARNEELEQLRQLQRDLTDFIVHDLKSPLSVVQLNLSWVVERMGLYPNAPVEPLTEIEGALRELKRMIEDMLALSRLEVHATQPTSRPVDLATLLTDLGRALGREAVRKGVGVRVDASPDAVTSADPVLLVRAFETLGELLLRHVAPGGRLSFGLRRVGEWYEVSLGHNGPPAGDPERGVLEAMVAGEAPVDAPPDVFVGLERSFSLCERVIRAHGGTLSLGGNAQWPVCLVVRLASEVEPPPPSKGTGLRPRDTPT